MQLVNVELLQSHPKNSYFFDDITGDKWRDFLESVHTSGVIEPIVVSGDYVIVSGHQRVRACRELGIEKILAEVHLYNSEDAVLKDLIETNIRQRGVVDNPVKIGRIAQELARLYNITDATKEEAAEVRGRILSLTGRRADYINRAKRIAQLTPELQAAVENGQIPATVAGDTLSRLSEDEQLQFVLTLSVIEKWSQQQVEAYAAMIQDKDERIAELQKDLADMEDGDAVLELRQQTRTAYERAEFMQKIIRDKEKEIERLKGEKHLPPVVLSAEGLGTCVQRFIDELDAFEDMIKRQTNRRTHRTYYNWLNEAAEAIKRLQLECNVTYDEVAN